MGSEIAERAVHAIASQPWAAAAAIGAAAAAIVGEWLLRRYPRLSRVSFGAAIGASVAVALRLAWRTLWLCDDAFISFRYAQNLAAGQGLVFNPGEWVEGYTNFLWTATLGGLARVGVSIPHAALALDLLALVSVIVLAAMTVRTAAPNPPAIPFAAVALAGSHAFTTYGSSGLETMPATALVVAATLMLVSDREALAGALLTCAALTRPDHLLFAPAMGAALVAEDVYFSRRFQLRRYARFAAPMIAFALYYLARWRAYGDFFPNTYYAKSGGDPYYRQGLIYLQEFLAGSGGWLWLPVALLLCACRPRSPRELRLRIFALGGSATYGLYIVRVGGDFMQYRFFVVVMPLIAIAAEVLARWRLRDAPLKRALPLASFAALSLAAWVIPIRLIARQEKWLNIAAEETFYSVTSVFPLKVDSGLWDLGVNLRSALVARGLRPKLAEGCVGMIGFSSGLPMVDLYGLTNRHVAHQPVQVRGRPGHEKLAGIDEALAEGAVVSLQPLWPDWKDQTRVVVEGTELYLVRYDAELLRSLSKIPGATVPDVEGQLAKAQPENGRRALAFYRRFLAGSAAGDALLRRLEDRLGVVADFEKPTDAAEALEPFHLVSMESNHVLTSIGHHGAGSTRFRVGPLRGTELRFLMRATTSQASVALEVDGQQVALVAPDSLDGDEPRAFKIEPGLAGHAAEVVVTDQDPADAAGIEVDNFHWPLARPPPGEAPLDVYQALLSSEEELPRSDPGYAAAHSRVLARWSFDGLDFGAVSRRTGDAFGTGPVAGALADQTAVFGAHGPRLVNSYHGGDSSTGELRLLLGPADGRAVAFLIGGGSNCAETWAAVFVGEREIARVCGQGDEVLRPFAVALPRSSELAELRVVDHGVGGWGHLLIDEVAVLACGVIFDAP